MGLGLECVWRYAQALSRKPFPKKVDPDIPSYVLYSCGEKK